MNRMGANTVHQSPQLSSSTVSDFSCPILSETFSPTPANCCAISISTSCAVSKCWAKERMSSQYSGCSCCTWSDHLSSMSCISEQGTICTFICPYNSLHKLSLSTERLVTVKFSPNALQSLSTAMEVGLAHETLNATFLRTQSELVNCQNVVRISLAHCSPNTSASRPRDLMLFS